MAYFNIYKASAGSGKTYTLVKEYIKRGLSTNNQIAHKSLLAITFTNKAASEMKTRIVETLFHFSQGFKNIKDDSCQQLYCDLKLELKYTDSQLVKKSSKLLSDIIHYYSLFSVSTIDKFIHKIIRGFSYELDLPSNFEVEMDNEKMIQDSVISLIDEVGLDHILTKILINYSNHKIKEDKNWDIQEDLIKVSKQLFKDYTIFFTENLLAPELLKKKQQELILKIKSFEQKIANTRNEIDKLIVGIPDSAFLYKDLPRYLNKIKKKPYVDIDFSQRLYSSVQDDRWYKKSESIENKSKIDQISNLLCARLQNLFELIEKEHPHYLFHRTCYSSFFLISVLSKIEQKIINIKNENNLIHISEFNQIIYNFLKKSPAPFIYEKIGNRFDHYFIDEFQDTSKIQWRNLIPLLEEALSKGGTCLIVGDGKQSIYRWRGGDVSQFLELCNEDEKMVLNQFSTNVESLNINYRSGQNIVDFNNRFFSFLSKKLTHPYNKLYNKLEQKTRVNRKEQGYVEISVLENKNIDLVKDTLQLTYEKIQLIINDNYNFSDIVVLTRNNKEITKIANYLTENGVPIVSSESLLLKSSPTIQFLIHNLAIILDDTDSLSKAKFLEHLIYNHTIQTESPHKTISDYAKKNNKEFQSFLNKNGVAWDIINFKSLNIYELIEVLVRLFKLDKKYNLYVVFFLDFVFEFTVKYTSSINEFLNYWNQKKDVTSIVIPPGINAVEIMTIHKSKGLQFPVVIFPFANWKEDLGKDKGWFDVNSFFSNQESNLFTLLPLKKELESWPSPFPEHYQRHVSDILLDNINLLYVAMTRPKDRLYVISNSDPRKGAIYKYFTDYFNMEEGLNNANHFVLGKKMPLDSKSELLKTIEKSGFISQNWRDRIRIKEKRGFNKSLKQKYSISWGDLIHEIMAGVNTTSDIEVMLNKLNIITTHGTKTFKRIKKEIEKIINDPQIAHLFKTGLDVFSEYNILNTDGSIYRPDRVVVHSEKEASLIDYKTGKEEKKHKVQMKKYEEILLNMGYKKINKYLIYLTTGDIYKLQ